MSLNVRVLLVEDNENAGAALQELLQFEGHEVALARSIADARLLIASQDFDIALVDVRLPDGDGTTLVPSLKHKHTRVFIASGSAKLTLEGMELAFEDPSQLAASCGADGALSKPIDYELLLKVITNELH